MFASDGSALNWRIFSSTIAVFAVAVGTGSDGLQAKIAPKQTAPKITLARRDFMEQAKSLKVKTHRFFLKEIGSQPPGGCRGIADFLSVLRRIPSGSGQVFRGRAMQWITGNDG
jgi:hypothetical protein